MESQTSHHDKMVEGGFEVVNRSKSSQRGGKRWRGKPANSAPRGSYRPSGGFTYNRRSTVASEMNTPERRFRNLVEKVEKVLFVVESLLTMNLLGALTYSILKIDNFTNAATQMESLYKMCFVAGAETKRRPQTSLKRARRIARKGFSPQNVVCYGVGSPESSNRSVHQLAFLLLLRKYIDTSLVHIYDPVLSDMDKRLIKHFKCHLIPENEEARRRIEEPTLFFMPFCGRQLYNNVLGSNWDETRLRHVCIVGNGFHSIISTAISDIQEQYLLRVVKSAAVEEITLPNYDIVKDAFNDQAFHFFPQDKLPQQSCLEFWTPANSPTKAEFDPEFVARQP